MIFQMISLVTYRTVPMPTATVWQSSEIGPFPWWPLLGLGSLYYQPGYNIHIVFKQFFSMCLEWCGSNRSTTYRGRASHEQNEMNLPLHNFLFPFIHHGREVIFCGIPIRLPFTWLSSSRWRPVIISLNCCIPVQFKILFTFIHRIGSRFSLTCSIIG